MKLSYIIPVYNVEKYIRQCVDSVFSQTFDDFEIILVDDESPDGCPAICDEYAEKYPDIVRVVHKKNAGLAAARNDGIKLAQGEYIFFVDSDDFLAENKIGELYSIAKQNRLDILHTSFHSFNDDNISEKFKSKIGFETDRLYDHKQMENELCFAPLRRTTIYVWRNLYNREFILKNGIMFDENLRMIEDSPFNILAFSKAERFMAVDIPIYRYRIRQGSLQRKFVENYCDVLSYQWRLKIRYFEENCTSQKEFYENLAEFTIRNMLPTLLGNIYNNKDRVSCYSELKKIGKSEMMKKSFEDYDINIFKSKSLDWVATKFIMKDKYVAAHIICKKILYK